MAAMAKKGQPRQAERISDRLSWCSSDCFGQKGPDDQGESCRRNTAQLLHANSARYDTMHANEDFTDPGHFEIPLRILAHA